MSIQSAGANKGHGRDSGERVRRVNRMLSDQDRKEDAWIDLGTGARYIPKSLSWPHLRKITGRTWMICGSGTAVFALFVMIWALVFKTEDINLKIQSMHWERKIEIEQFRTLTEEDWSPPGDARIKDSWQAIHHYDSVLVGYSSHTSCSGTGTNRSCSTYRSPVYEQVPVYRTMYRYEIDRWRTSRWLVTSAEGQSPAWADTSDPIYKDVKVIGQERIGNERAESYKVVMDEVGGDHRHFDYGAPLATWLRLKVGTEVIGHVNAQDHLRGVNWPKNT